MPQTPRAWIEINKDHLKNNIKAIQTLLPPETQYALVIKANAYGHGMELISQYCEQEQLVDLFCVAYLTEALTLRAHGITKPILVMTYCDEDIHKAIMQAIDISIATFDGLLLVHTIAQQLNKKVHIHIKIDTGLSRFGFIPHQIEQLITIIKNTSHLTICGIYSHFAQSNNTDQSYSDQQRLLFKHIIAQFFSAGIRPQYIHQQNSAGIMTQKDGLYNMVRVGALAYGLWSSPFQKELFEQESSKSIHQVLSFKSSIIDIKIIPQYTAIGYDCSFITQRKTITAKIPVGYADGYFRYLGLKTNQAYVFIKNKYAPIIGYIAMNVITIDITDIQEVVIGDEVTLIGDIPHITANELAHTIGSGNPREITTLLNPTIKRVMI